MSALEYALDKKIESTQRALKNWKKVQAKMQIENAFLRIVNKVSVKERKKNQALNRGKTLKRI
jgi:uncharacterized protein (DUF1919 family)